MASFVFRRVKHTHLLIAPAVSFTLFNLLGKDKASSKDKFHSCCSAQDLTNLDEKKKKLHSDRSGMTGEEIFHGLFPMRQLWKSSMPHPALWDDNWDELKGPDDKEHRRQIRSNGVTRHIILIRHGQYDETHKEDEKKVLTPLGREQADKTGKRIAEIIRGIEGDDRFGPCHLKVVRVSDLTRAKETSDIICKHLPSIERSEPDPLLNEGRPCHNIPCGNVRKSVIQKIDEHHPRIEEAFRKYFYRASLPQIDGDSSVENESNILSVNDENQGKIQPKHEFEIIVCHANVIRYFFCRALQLPPEAWLRLCIFNCSLNYFTIRPSGTVSCRMLGDIGHLGYDNSTFSMHHGFNW